MSRKTLVRNLVDDADCLADIASRPVHVLAARVLGEESYEIERSLTSKVLFTLRELFSAGGHSARSQANVIRDGTPRVVLWAFTEMVLTDERIRTMRPIRFGAAPQEISPRRRPNTGGWPSRTRLSSVRRMNSTSSFNGPCGTERGDEQ